MFGLTLPGIPARAMAIGAALCLVLGRATAQVPTPPAGLTLAEATRRALASNPAIAAARLQRDIDVAGVAVAAERPNLDVLYEQARETPRQSFGITVPLELGGKRDRRIDLAEATVAVSVADVGRAIAAVRYAVRRAYFDAVAAAVREQIAEDLRDLAQRARDAADARVEAGDVPQSDVTMAELALANSDNELAGARGEFVATRAELNILMGQPAGSPVTLAESLTGGQSPTPQEALDLATHANAELQAIDRQLVAQLARIGLAKAMTVPDIAAGAAFTYDAEPEFQFGWRLSGGVTLPLFTRHRAGVAVEEATLARLTKEREGLMARMAGSIAAAEARAEAGHDQVIRYDASILPLVIEAERHAQIAYGGGQIGLPALVQALQIAREARQRGLQAGLDYQHALADLEQAVGAPLK